MDIVMEGDALQVVNEINEDFPFLSRCNDPPQTTQYCTLLAPPNQTSYEITHLGTTLVEARLTAEF
jgi:hypothetical protein